MIDADDGFHHYGPEISVPTSDRVLASGPETAVKLMLVSWTNPLGAEPGPGRVQLQLTTAEDVTGTYVELAPDEAQALAAALLELAATAEPAGTEKHS